MKNKVVLLVFGLLLSSVSHADSPVLDNLTSDDINKVLTEFSANFLHTSVSGAQSLGDIWGIEVGVVAGITKTPDLENLVKQTDPDTTVDKIAHAGALVRVSVPFGITGELNILPELDIADVSLQNTSAAIQWSFSQVFFPDFILDAAIKGHYTKSEMSYTQKITNSTVTALGLNSVDGTVILENDVIGADLLVSAEFLFIEPYVGLGFAKSSGELRLEVEVPGVSIFNIPGQTAATGSESDDSTSHLLMGVNLNIFLVKIGAEYSRAFGTDRISAKLSLYF